MWGNDQFGFQRWGRTAEEWGIDPDDLTRRGVTEYPGETYMGLPIGRSHSFMDEGGTDGCPVLQDKKGKLWLEVEEGVYWRLRWVYWDVDPEKR